MTFEESSDENHRVEMTIRVPAKNFQILYDAILALSEKTQTNSVTVDDVTKEYFDTTESIKNKEALRARYRDILKKAVVMVGFLFWILLFGS